MAGFAIHGSWRELDHDLGIGSPLLAAFIGAAREAGHHGMIADIEARNFAVIRLHERFDFQHVGTVQEVGARFGRRLDLPIMQLPPS
ncbi:GNAT family N-acetyltransferase [Streptomyces sp. NPDC091217]|uniref:GNAT family N-acetyltransferase n=1 Tax=Streptomyces sp. NPDC091217 TaxID=3365975 RepID=UPI003809863A